MIAPLLFLFRKLFSHVFFGIPKTRRFFKFLCFDHIFLFAGKPVYFFLQCLQGNRRGEFFQPQLGGRLVDQIDCLIGQKTVCDVTPRKIGGRMDRLIRNFHLVMGFIFIPNPLQYFYGLLGRGLRNKDRLKSSLERRILFDMLAVFGNRRCADDLDIPSRQSGF
ncbi:hypothetical protein SDC9_131281 [bioreactor metagenome]|uniref:Uncharacterized protein n=1 Tax=bioreactor metagenome TaxID=1076179 RepID=A0A645D3Z9_9ZZZZ